MANKSIENNICEAIELIVQNAVDNARYDKTIQAIVIKNIDELSGKYEVSYQDATFIAYSTDTEIKYPNGASVSILIPGNDMSRDKVILGMGKNYKSSSNSKKDNLNNGLLFNGNNCIKDNRQFNLNSFSGRQIKLLYDKEQNINLVNLNIEDTKQYLTKSENLLIGAEIKTSLISSQQFRGNYGIVCELDFIDNAAGNKVTRNYIIDVNKIFGNPYRQKIYTYHSEIFPIDGKNFDSIKRIYLFSYGFPQQEENKASDIFIKNLELVGISKVQKNEKDLLSLTIDISDGNSFTSQQGNNETKTLKANLFKGLKKIDANNYKVDFYWFKENLTVDTKSELYNNYGGNGWECLNNFNILNSQENLREWNAAGDIFTISKGLNLAKENRYKCVAVYNTEKAAADFTINNLSQAYNIIIESDSGDKFYFDIGTPSLITKVNGEDKKDNDFKYIWTREEKGISTKIDETIEENTEYDNAVAALNRLQEQIKNGQILLEANKDNINTLKEKINSFSNKTRVQKNEVFKIQMSSVDKSITYKCAVYKDNIYIGTGEITLTNSLAIEDGYKLEIVNGNQVFKYNEAGISPASDSLDDKINIKPLEFKIFNNLGQELDKEITNKCKTKWIVPKEESFISIPATYTTKEEDVVNKTKIYNDYLTLDYRIAERFNNRNNRNTIQLQVYYKDIILTAQTNFSFIKEGEPGTNGTSFVCKIVPNTDEEIDYPMLTHTKGQGGSLNYTPKESGKWLRAQLWHNGEKIYDAAAAGQTTEGKNITLVWSVLRNKYNDNTSDTTSLVINANSGAMGFDGYMGDRHPANIIKVEMVYDGITYYATLPIITAVEENSNYNIKLKPKTGFQYVVYNSEGRMPQYDNSLPFEIEVYQNINGKKENITNIKNEYQLNYEWNIKGRIFDIEWIQPEYLKLENNRVSLNDNSLKVKPIDSFNGECVSVGLECKVSQNNQEVGKIHIPIHMLLNKYFNAAINGWDGNKVSIDAKGSGAVLAPQVGAGQKESDNSFTGMFMGSTREPNQKETDVGLFGYSSGERTIFLNSKNGSAIFGKNGKGQIIIDPRNSAFLYSSNFWNRYNTTGKDKGLPQTNFTYNANTKKYNGQSASGEGMLIDLSSSRVVWGNGNFNVDENGFLTAKGGGEIAGWKIGDNKLFSAAQINGNPKVTIDSNLSSVYSNNKTEMTSSRDGFYIGSDGFALGRYNAARGKNPFQVNNEGFLYSDSGQIGGFTIFENSLRAGSGNSQVGINSKGGWAFWAGNPDTGVFPFKVSHDGKMYTTSGEIGGYRIGKDTLIGGAGGTQVGMCSRQGSAWAFWAGAEDSGRAPFKVGHSGGLYSTSGQIGGWNIGTDRLSGGSMNIYANGSMNGPGWSIDTNGNATFNNVRITQDSYSRQSDLIQYRDFRVNSNGRMYATQGTFRGAISSGSSITGSSISGGSININDGGGHYFSMGGNSDHPSCSSLNCQDSLNFGAGNGIEISGKSGKVNRARSGQVTINANGIWLNGDVRVNDTNFFSSDRYYTTDHGNTYKGRSENVKIGNITLQFLNGIFIKTF